jgi:ribosomal-protein-alanine N-acetyltransferase
MNDEVYISFPCPHCGNTVDYIESYAETLQPCPYCTEDLIVPARTGEEGGKLPLPIETTRLTMRRLELDDLSDAVEILTEPDTFRHEEQDAWSEDGVKRWLEEEVKSRLSDQKGRLALGIIRLDNHKLIGLLWLSYSKPNRQEVAVVIQINTSQMRKGFGSEALQSALSFCFNDVRLHRVTAVCATNDLASIRLLTKVGMRKEAECVKDRFIDGEWANSSWYAVLEEEFFGEARPTQT